MTDVKTELATCLSQWTRVEDELAVTFSLAVSGRIFQPAVESFFTIRSADSKCDVTNAALMHLKLPDDVHQERKRLIEKFKKKCKKRNEMAHSEIMSIPSRDWVKRGKNYPLVSGDFEGVVMPFSFFNRTQFRLAARAMDAVEPEEMPDLIDVQNALYLDDITARTRSFMQLRRELQAFNAKLVDLVKDPEIGLSVELA